MQSGQNNLDLSQLHPFVQKQMQRPEEQKVLNSAEYRKLPEFQQFIKSIIATSDYMKLVNELEAIYEQLLIPMTAFSELAGPLLKMHESLKIVVVEANKAIDQKAFDVDKTNRQLSALLQQLKVLMDQDEASYQKGLHTIPKIQAKLDDIAKRKISIVGVICSSPFDPKIEASYKNSVPEMMDALVSRRKFLVDVKTIMRDFIELLGKLLQLLLMSRGKSEAEINLLKANLKNVLEKLNTMQPTADKIKLIFTNDPALVLQRVQKDLADVQLPLPSLNPKQGNLSPAPGSSNAIMITKLQPRLESKEGQQHSPSTPPGMVRTQTNTPEGHSPVRKSSGSSPDSSPPSSPGSAQTQPMTFPVQEQRKEGQPMLNSAPSFQASAHSRLQGANLANQRAAAANGVGASVQRKSSPNI